jgi:ribonuclease BN (tRNA processing enzyme)
LTHGSAEVLADIDSVVAEARAMLPKTEIIFAEDKMKVQLAAKKNRLG